MCRKSRHAFSRECSSLSNQSLPDCAISPPIPLGTIGKQLIKRFFAYKEFFRGTTCGAEQNAAKRLKNIKF